MCNSMHVTNCAVVPCRSKETVSPRKCNAATDQNKMCFSHAAVRMGYKLHIGQLLATHFDTCNQGSGLDQPYTAHHGKLYTLQTQHDCSAATVIIPPAVLGCLVSTCKAVG